MGWKTGLGGGEQMEVMSACFRQKEQPVQGSQWHCVPWCNPPKGSGACVSVLAQLLLGHVTLDKLFPTVGWSLQHKTSMLGEGGLGLTKQCAQCGILPDPWPECRVSAASLHFGWRGYEPSSLLIKRMAFLKLTHPVHNSLFNVPMSVRR